MDSYIKELATKIFNEVLDYKKSSTLIEPYDKYYDYYVNGCIKTINVFLSNHHGKLLFLLKCDHCHYDECGDRIMSDSCVENICYNEEGHDFNYSIDVYFEYTCEKDIYNIFQQILVDHGLKVKFEFDD